MDLSDVHSFTVASIPVVLRSTKSFDQIVAFEIAARGAVTIPKKAGAMDLLLAVVSDGTKSYTKEDIDRIFIQSGAIHSMDAKSDYVDVSLKVLKKYIPTILPIFSEMIRVPNLDPKEIDISRMQMVSALENEQVEPDQILQFLSGKAFFADHPYAMRPSGYLETLPKITRDDLVSLLPEIFNRQNLVISIVGDLSESEAKQLVQTYFGNLPEGKPAPRVEKNIAAKPNALAYQRVEAPTNYFMARFKAPSLMHPDYPALNLVSQILDNRLFEEVRTKRGLTYSVHCGLGNSAINSGYLYLTSTKLEEALPVIFDEIKKIKTEEIDAGHLELQVRKFTSSWYMSREQSSSQASIFSLYEILGNGWKDSNTFIERLKKVKPKDLNEVAQKYFKDYTMTLVGPNTLDEKKLSALLK